ncbi:MAG: hypothetical protein ACREQ2_24735 [Candidatus Binatia bacterium]
MKAKGNSPVHAYRAVIQGLPAVYACDAQAESRFTMTPRSLSGNEHRTLANQFKKILDFMSRPE